MSLFNKCLSQIRRISTDELNKINDLVTREGKRREHQNNIDDKKDFNK